MREYSWVECGFLFCPSVYFTVGLKNFRNKKFRKKQWEKKRKEKKTVEKNLRKDISGIFLSPKMLKLILKHDVKYNKA